jgi:type II secretory pathway component PulJ
MKANGWASNIFLTDGFPRSMENWNSWKAVVGDEAEVVGILHLVCTEEIMLERIMKRAQTSGRNDDNPEVLKQRFEVNQKETSPVLELFRADNKVFDIDAGGDVETVKNLAFKQVDSLKLFSGTFSEGSLEIRSYLQSKVDVFVKPLMTDIIRERPEDVHAFIVEWMSSKGQEIKDGKA